jgi:serine/threonine protein kinase
VLTYTLRQIRHKLSDEQQRSIYKYLAKTISIMSKNGFTHNDIHDRNIMCDDKMKRWYIIDYGMILHKSFIKNTYDKTINNRRDKLSLIKSFVLHPIQDYKKYKWAPFNTFIKRVKADKRYSVIKKYILPTSKDKMAHRLIEVLCRILYYDLYICAIGLSETPLWKKFKDYEQPNKRFLLNAIVSAQR